MASRVNEIKWLLRPLGSVISHERIAKGVIMHSTKLKGRWPVRNQFSILVTCRVDSKLALMLCTCDVKIFFRPPTFGPKIPGGRKVETIQKNV